MPRIHNVKKSRVDQGSCGRCRDELPKGTPYRWIKFRYGGKQKRCMKSSCAFRQSDLTQSDKLSRVYGAGETIEDAMMSVDVLDGEPQESVDNARLLVEAVDEALGEIEEVADEYNESADNIEYEFDYSPTAELCRENAENLESWHSDLDQAKDELDSAIETVEAEITEFNDRGDEHRLDEIDLSELRDQISNVESSASDCPI